jgi:hypothetical protein
MMMKALILLVVLMIPGIAVSAVRDVPEKPHVESFKINFNKERLRAFCLTIDARTIKEQVRDRKRGELSGPVIVFFQGHAQRPSDAYAFTSSLAKMSKSGIVIIPVCDTPYGKDDALRGDSGKDVVLMEMVRRILSSKGITVKDYAPLSSSNLLINNSRIDSVNGGISAELISVGWSHGGILARRFAHAYPGSVVGLGQVCPAGYEHWSPSGLTGRFMHESLRISKLVLKGHAQDSLRSAWGFTRGFAGDFFRSIPSAIVDMHPAKLGRVGKDIQDCSAYCDSSNCSVSGLDYVVVIFADQDTCMDICRITGCSDPEKITEEQAGMFWETFYGDALDSQTRLTLKVLPGSHLAPVTHSALYAQTVLEYLDQMQDSLKE